MMPLVQVHQNDLFRLQNRANKPWTVRLASFARGILLLAAGAALLAVLVRARVKQMIVPAIVIALSVLVIAVDDASFLGGIRPFDGGDDGIFYDGFDGFD